MPLLSDRIQTEEERKLTLDWLEVRQFVKEKTGKRPDINAILFLIGMNELGVVRAFSKEEKQDLMHIAVCKLFENTHYRFVDFDEENWPHYEQIENMPRINLRDQEALLKQHIVKYFKENIF